MFSNCEQTSNHFTWTSQCRLKLGALTKRCRTLYNIFLRCYFYFTDRYLIENTIMFCIFTRGLARAPWITSVAHRWSRLYGVHVYREGSEDRNQVPPLPHTANTDVGMVCGWERASGAGWGMGQEDEMTEGVEGGEGYKCGEGKIEGVRARGTGAQTSTTRRCAEVFRCPRPKPRKTDTGGWLCGLLCALERGEPRNISQV